MKIHSSIVTGGAGFVGSHLTERLVEEGCSARSNAQFWVIAVPVLVAFVAILGIGGWIGWTMATTPPPKPIEDFPNSEETKEAENKEPAKP